MPFLRSLLTLLLFASAAAADDVLRTLDNKTVSGTLVGLSDKEVSIKLADGAVVKTPLEYVIAVDCRPVKGIPAGTEHSVIGLVDDTSLLCSKYAIKGRNVEATLLGGQNVSIPIASVTSILRGAEDGRLKEAFMALLANKVKRDRVVINKGGLNDLQGTIGEADAQGNKIKFLSADGANLDVPIVNLQGMIFYRPDGAGVGAANPVCMVYDTAGNAIAATKVITSGGKVAIVTTIPNVTIQWETAAVARFDYNMGKLSYLSDMIPTKIVEKSGVGLIVAYRKDVNLDGDPIVLDRPYPKGLSLHAYSELEYDLKGKFKKFSAVLGVDQRIGSESQPKVTIEVDGKVAFSRIITVKDNIVPVEISVANASTIRIIVSSQNFLDLHDHVTIANPKVTQ